MDKILKITKDGSDNILLNTLYEGDLNLGANYPIETHSIYESNSIKKVYFTDYRNQPRMVVTDTDYIDTADDNQFDFVQNVTGRENITIEKLDTGFGIFTSGVVQYGFTYYNQYRSETNLVYLSDLYYISLPNRGGKPDETVGSSFKITIDNLDLRFKRIKLYSVIRSSVDTTPIVKELIDLPVPQSQSITFVDNNTLGSIITSSELLYKGGEPIAIKTMDTKDNVLFMGNITLLRKSVGNMILTNGTLINTTIKDAIHSNNTITFIPKFMYSEDSVNKYYGYKPTLNKNSYQCRTLKSREWYRFGLIFQHKSGKWSEPVWIDDKQVNIIPTIERPSNITTVYGIKALYNFDPNGYIMERLNNDGYIAVKPVIVYPDTDDREVLVQGVLNPTVFNTRDRYTASIDNMASWFFRPVITNTKSKDNPKLGSPAEYKHNRCLPPNTSRNCEIQNMETNIQDSYFDNTVTSKTKFTDNNSECFFIDSSVVTMNSPDIDLSDSLSYIDGKNLKMRIIGQVPLTGFYGDMDLTAGPPRGDYARGFIRRQLNLTNFNDPSKGANIQLSIPCWEDSADPSYSLLRGNENRYYVVYPWHANRPLTSDQVSDDRPAMLKQKKLSNLRYSGYTKFFNTPINFDIGPLTLFNSEEDILSRVDANSSYFGRTISYKGNIDKVLVTNTTSDCSGFHTTVIDASSDLESNFNLPYKAFPSWGLEVVNEYIAREPISMKYKSTPHLVFSLNTDSSGNQYILPNYLVTQDNNKTVFWKDDSYSTVTKEVNEVNDLYGYLWLAEIYRDDVTSATRFGGQTQNAFESNTWLPCGETWSFFDNNGKLKSGIPIEFIDGDTYLQRYDCLKTYPFTLEDQNSVVEILSYLTETRVNIDGRYDKNRGNLSNLVAMPSNFNLINPIYSQKDNFLSYKSIDYSIFYENIFPTSFTWSNAKILNSNIDSWTRTSLANVEQATQDCGEIRKIKTFNDAVYLFQDKGISNILYNSRVQLSTTDGVPIELGNSGKYEGIKYISNNIGLRNKWGMCESNRGLWFVDDLSKSIYRLSSNGLENISDSMGFHNWTKDNIKSLDEWNITDYSNFTIQYDKINNDVYIINSTDCLLFNESLNKFTSFMSYEDTPYIFNIWDNLISLRGTTGAYNNTDSNFSFSLWDNNKGTYNSFFDTSKDSSITILVNPDVLNDKVFTTSEIIGDKWTISNNIKTLDCSSPISSLKVWNEYQSGTLNLTENLTIASPTTKERYRTWRYKLPRVTGIGITRTDLPSNPYTINYFDRLRGNWIYVEFKHTPTTTNNIIDNKEIIIHSMTFNYLL